jgi:flagellar biosynthesis protein FliP
MYKEASSFIQNQPKTELFSSESALFVVDVIEVSKEPLRKFLQKNTTRNHINYFYKLAYSKFPQEFKKNLSTSDFIVIIPAYITSQLKGAFEIGVLIYLPFFVIDLVTSNILLAMGMMMLSPLTIALPLKLLLLVMVDGWTLIVQGIVQTYK